MPHLVTQIFSLVGRKIVLHRAYKGRRKGAIIRELSSMRFICLMYPDEVFFVNAHRSEFKLPPLARDLRRSVRLPDDSEGFAYEGNPNF